MLGGSKVGELTKIGYSDRLYTHTVWSSLKIVIPCPILARVCKIELLSVKHDCASVSRHNPSPWGRSANTFIEDWETGSSLPTLVDSSQYAILHHGWGESLDPAKEIKTIKKL